MRRAASSARSRSPMAIARRIAIAILAVAIGAVATLACLGRGPVPAVVPPAGSADPTLHVECRFEGLADGPLVLAAYASADGHEPLPPAVNGDWRSGPGRRERVQTFPAYRADDPVRATPERTTIVLQPLGEIDGEWADTFERIRRFTQAFCVLSAAVHESSARA